MKQLRFQLSFLSFWLGVLLIIQLSCSQQKPYRQEDISQGSELNLAVSQQRGLQDKKGIIFYVEVDGQSLSAYQHDKQLWSTNIINAIGKPQVGEPVIRYLKVEENQIFIIVGKHAFVEVNPKNGQAEYKGSD